MNLKPIIYDQEQLTPFYAQYRERLCHADSSLDARLRMGAMQEVEFERLSRSFDVVLLDAFGVLNLGKKAITGAADVVNRLKKEGRPFCVVSNNASQSPQQLEKQFQAMGFDIDQGSILSSGMAVSPFVSTSRFHNLPYYLVGTPESALAYAPDPERLMVNRFDLSGDTKKNIEKIDWRAGKYILLCSNRDYYGGVQQQQVETLLAEKSLPILLANPDLAAPGSSGEMSAVAGYTAAQWVKDFGCEMWGVGKPFSPIFSMVRQRFPKINPQRFLMVGDTLDTDVLGGTAQGFTTCLTLSGAYAKERDLETLCTSRGILPDFMVQSIAT